MTYYQSFKDFFALEEQGYYKIWIDSSNMLRAEDGTHAKSMYWSSNSLEGLAWEVGATEVRSDGNTYPLKNSALRKAKEKLDEEKNMAETTDTQVFSTNPVSEPFLQATPEFLAKLQNAIDWAVINQPELIQYAPEMYANLFSPTTVHELKEQGFPVQETDFTPVVGVGFSQNNLLLYGAVALAAIALLK